QQRLGQHRLPEDRGRQRRRHERRDLDGLRQLREHGEREYCGRQAREVDHRAVRADARPERRQRRLRPRRRVDLHVRAPARRQEPDAGEPDEGAPQSERRGSVRVSRHEAADVGEGQLPLRAADLREVERRRHGSVAAVRQDLRQPPLATADVVVIGGGALGAATAFHLRRLGVSDVVLLERDTLASGSTSKSAGGIRAQFADELNIRIALRSLAEFEAMADEIAFRQDGYLFLLDDERDAADFRAALALQQSLGVDSRELTPTEARALVPQLSLDDLVCATFCERDGYATPEAVVQWYARES